jgi:hypothetical protein
MSSPSSSGPRGYSTLPVVIAAVFLDGRMAVIVTMVHRPERPPRKRKAVALQVPAIVRKRTRPMRCRPHPPKIVQRLPMLNAECVPLRSLAVRPRHANRGGQCRADWDDALCPGHLRAVQPRGLPPDRRAVGLRARRELRWLLGCRLAGRAEWAQAHADTPSGRWNRPRLA